MPDVGTLSYQAKRRAIELPSQMITAYTATPYLLRLFGVPSTGRLKLYQISHDLQCTECCLFFLERWPTITRRAYFGEDLYRHEAKHRQKVPDAMFLHPRTRKPLAALEYTGAYRPERLRGFHRDMAARDDIPSYFLF
jgi:hypothetical protein